MASRKKLFIPYIILGLGCLGWSSAWLFGKSSIEEKVLSRLGDKYACAKTSISGFPFRYDLACDKAKITEDDVIFHAEKLVVTSRMISPKHLIGEITTPLLVETPTHLYKIEAKALNFSVNGEKDKTGRVSVIAEDGILFRGQTQLGFSKNFEFHMVREKQETLNAFMTIDKLNTPVLTREKLDATLTLAFNSSPSHPFNTWFKNNGEVKITGLKINADEFKFNGFGSLNAQQNGDLTLQFSDVSSLLKAIPLPVQGIDRLLPLLGKRTKIDDKEATEFSLKVNEGKVMLGGFQVYKLPPID